MTINQTGPHIPRVPREAFEDAAGLMKGLDGSGQTTTTVAEGKTLTQIAADAGITMEELYRLNPQFDPNKADGEVDGERNGNSGWDPDFLRIGDTIAIPLRASAIAAAGGNTEGGGPSNEVPEIVPVTTNAAQGAQPANPSGQQAGIAEGNELGVYNPAQPLDKQYL